MFLNDLFCEGKLDDFHRIATQRYAVVDDSGNRRLVTDSLDAAISVAEKIGGHIRKVFGPKPPRPGTIPLKQVTEDESLSNEAVLVSVFRKKDHKNNKKIYVWRIGPRHYQLEDGVTRKIITVQNTPFKKLLSIFDGKGFTQNVNESGCFRKRT